MSNLPPSALDEDDAVNVPTTPTPYSHLHRSISRTSQWSVPETPLHHNQGTSYFPSSSPPPPSSWQHTSPLNVRNASVSTLPTRRAMRSTSVSSSQGASYRHRGEASREREGDSDYSDEGEEDVEYREHRRRAGKSTAPPEPERNDSGEGEESDENGEPVTLKDRQSLINVEHPFGLPIWKPALYKKSRSVTRNADAALHSIPSAQVERHLLPGNLFWVIVFGWWLGIVCFVVSAVLYITPIGGRKYANLVFGLGWYIAWPFGKYVEGDDPMDALSDDEAEIPDRQRWSGSNDTVRGVPPSAGADDASVDTVRLDESESQRIRIVQPSPREERSPLLRHRESALPTPSKSYGTTKYTPPAPATYGTAEFVTTTKASDWLGRICFWLAFVSIIAPLMLLVCLICWALVVTIPMAKLNWQLLKFMFTRPFTIRFCAAPPIVVVAAPPETQSATNAQTMNQEQPATVPFSVKHPRLSEGQLAPSGSPTSTVLLCVYHAVGAQYYKYTVGGVNILFINLLPIVFFVIFDGFVLLPMVEKMEHEGKHVPALLAAVASEGAIFLLSLLSVIPLSYFIGMAVASISAQSSIGMGAVINATFGSIIEIILYSIALTQGKGHLVEGSIVGSLLAGVLLMPGMSMCSSAVRRKEQKFNAKSAGVTSMMLIMAIIGALAPTLFYQTYGNFQLVCSGCPSTPNQGGTPWICDHCYYKHPDPVDDPFYQSSVKNLMYLCAGILLFSYLIGLWFSLRTHASQIWRNPQPLLEQDLPTHHRMSLHPKPMASATSTSNVFPGQSPLIRRTSANANDQANGPAPIAAPSTARNPAPNMSPTFPRRVVSQQPSFTPVMESVDHVVKNDLQNLHLPAPMTTDDFTRAVAVATVSALRHQQVHGQASGKLRVSMGEAEGGEHGGHDAPSWSRFVSASVLLACTALYALIAELLVDVVDVILQGSGIDEKFLGVTLFALVPNTTEFMNAMSFALNGNIALSMEIGSAYALQVCLLQIPAMVAFSAWHDPQHMGEVARTFSLIFPRWDVIALILSMFLMTYTYIEAKSNYHRGSILIMSYLVLLSGFYFAPPTAVDVDTGHLHDATREFPALTVWQTIRWYIHSLIP